jgi:hypothetical protein
MAYADGLEHSIFYYGKFQRIDNVLKMNLQSVLCFHYPIRTEMDF